MRFPGSLRGKMFYVNLIGLVLGVLLYLLLTALGNLLVDRVYMGTEQVNRRKAQIYSQFSSFVTSEGVSGRDAAAVARWTASHEYVTIFLFGTGREQQLYSGGELVNVGAAQGYNPSVHGKLYPIRFADGLYQVAIDDNSQVRQRQVVKIVSFAAASLGLLLLDLWYMRRLTKRIIALSKEAAAVSSGDLDRSIAAPGADEVSALAASMDEMRRSVIARLGSEKRAWEANTELITAISHDIRTPMTSLIGYLGLLCEEGREESEQRQFAQSAYGKAMELKDLTDQLFRYFLVYGKAELELNLERFDGRLLLEQLLGEAEFDLADAGFTMQRIEFSGECSLLADPLFLKRVMDNLVSNIKKYADPTQPLVALSELKDGKLSLCISNAISADLARKESTKIGLRTCEKIMHAMGGSFTTLSENGRFAAEMSLPAEESSAE